MPAKKSRSSNRKSTGKSAQTDNVGLSPLDLKFKDTLQSSNRDIERFLQTGEHERELRRLFGDDEYIELVELSRQARRRNLRRAQKVLILPGIMGSELSQVTGNREDKVWLDFIDIFRGRLRLLALGQNSGKISASGVVQKYYLKLKLKLQYAGFNAEFYPYDWRQGIDKLGLEFSDILLKNQGVQIVAHRMGGLVT